jgi:hypothetical protein
MSANDIVSAGSAVFATWDGKQQFQNPESNNNSSGYPLVQIINSYDSGGISADVVCQGLIVGPNLQNVTGPTTFVCLVSSLILTDSFAGAVSVTMPAAPYPGMLVVIKDKTGTFSGNPLTVTCTGLHAVEVYGSTNTYVSSTTLSVNNLSVNYQWDPTTSHWTITSAYTP